MAKAQGELTPIQIETVDAAIAAIDPVCGADTPPNTAQALNAVNDAVFRLNTMQVEE
jgi:hypothetical protein